MNRFLMISMAGMAALSINAATLAVNGSYALTQDGAYHPVLCADGSKVLYSSMDYQGLKMLDFNRNEVVVISEASGAGFAPQFASDGEQVMYRCEGNMGKLRAKNVMSYDIVTDKTEELAPMSRKEISLSAYVDAALPQVRSDYREIVVTVNGKEQRLNPVADAYSYFGVKLSPDAKRILFVEAQKGIFVCNLDGSGLVAIGKGSYPSWLGNDFVLSTRCTDDGDHVTSSFIVATEVATGKVTEITAQDSMTEDATGSIEAGKVVCNDENGRLIVTKISVTE